MAEETAITEEIPQTVETTADAATVVELPRTVNLGEIYRSAIIRFAQNKVSGGSGGRAFPQTVYRQREVTVSRERLEAFDRLIHGDGRDEVPAGMMHILSFPASMALMASDDFPVPLPGLVHLSNRVRQYRRIDPEEAFDISVRVKNPAGHRSGTQFELHAVATSAADPGEACWEGTSTYLARGVQMGLPVVDQERAEFQPPELNAMWRLSGDVGRKYAAVSGDANPIHTSTVGAKILGMKTTIAHGMYLASRALTAMKPAEVEAFDWEVEFYRPVFIPGSVALNIDDSKYRRGAGGAIQCVAWKQKSEKQHFSCTVTVPKQ